MGVFLRVVQRRLVAMMAVGDDELLVRHGRSQQPDDRRIADAPDAMQHAVFVRNFGVGGTGAVEQDLLDAGRPDPNTA